jgi:catechol 2,3-dioxygenase-like lactoylglutathione lyase family enzyme
VKTAVLLLPLLLAGGVPAPSPPPNHTRVGPAVSGAFFALSVSDIEASTRWYSEHLGLRVTMESTDPGQPPVTVLEGEGLMVELIQHQGAADRPEGTRDPGDPVPARGIIKAGFMVHDFDGTLAAFRRQKGEIAFGPFPRRPSQRANMIVRDNEGNLIQILGD